MTVYESEALAIRLEGIIRNGESREHILVKIREMANDLRNYAISVDKVMRPN